MKITTLELEVIHTTAVICMYTWPQYECFSVHFCVITFTSVCVCVCGIGGTHCLLPCCYWAVSPDQQPCRPDRRWARLPLQPSLCSPSAAPDSAGRSPLEGGGRATERERMSGWEGRGQMWWGGRERLSWRKGESEERWRVGNRTSSIIALKWENSVNPKCIIFHSDNSGGPPCWDVSDQ